MDFQTLERIYNILVSVCGAREEERLSFLHNQSQPDFPREWRFQGKLGFGGKFWRNKNKLYVSCYSEDLTKKRISIIDEANSKLAELLK